MAPVADYPPGLVTSLLESIRRGDSKAEEDLLSLVHRDLRAMAQLKMRGERRGHTWQPTELVSELYLKLIGNRRIRAVNREHFFASAKIAMQRILVDHARARLAARRHGGLQILLDDCVIERAPGAGGTDLQPLVE